MSHPAACPHCGGTIVNQAQPDLLLRDARLNDDGSITVGESDLQADFTGPMVLFCHTCGSDYPQPSEVVEHFDEALKVSYPPGVQPGDAHYVGARVKWTCVSVLPEEAK